MLDVVRQLDVDIGDEIDLVGSTFKLGWGWHKRTMPMYEIGRKMQRNMATPPMSLSGGLQRHSRVLCDSLHRELARNVFSFGEHVVYPIAWKYNCTFRDIQHAPSAMSKRLIPWGLNPVRPKLKARKAVRVHARVVNAKNSRANMEDTTFLFHANCRFIMPRRVYWRRTTS